MIISPAYFGYPLPETGFLRLRQILGDPDADPPIPPLIPLKKSAWWDGVRNGRFPRPYKLTSRVSAWKVEEIRELLAGFQRRTDPRQFDVRHQANSHRDGPHAQIEQGSGPAKQRFSSDPKRHAS